MSEGVNSVIPRWSRSQVAETTILSDQSLASLPSQNFASEISPVMSRAALIFILGASREGFVLVATATGGGVGVKGNSSCALAGATASSVGTLERDDSLSAPAGATGACCDAWT